MEKREKPEARTTFHVRAAGGGDGASLAWLVERFSPYLLAQASYRLRGPLGAHVSPEDVVQDVWAVALRALPELRAAPGHEAATFLKFLSTTLLYRSNELTRRHLRRDRKAASTSEAPLSQLPRESVAVLSKIARKEAEQAVLREIEELPEADREVVVLRAIEQNSNQRVAELLGQTPNAVSLRFNRALARLRERCRGSVFDELDFSQET